MPKLIKDDAIVEDTWHLLDEDAVSLPEGNIIVSLSQWQEQATSLVNRQTLGIKLNSDQHPSLIADHLDKFAVIAINFPSLADGRGFSYARVLREEMNYSGEIRAVGGFMRDQLFFLKRCGFNAYALETNELEAALASFSDFSNSYQAAVDQPQPLFRRR